MTECAAGQDDTTLSVMLAARFGLCVGKDQHGRAYVGRPGTNHDAIAYFHEGDNPPAAALLAVIKAVASGEREVRAAPAVPQAPTRETLIKNAHWLADYLDKCDPGSGPVEAMHSAIDKLAMLSASPSIGAAPAGLWPLVRAALLEECRHAAANDMRLPPSFGKVEGRIAVPEDNILAVIERFDGAAPAGEGQKPGCAYPHCTCDPDAFDAPACAAEAGEQPPRNMDDLPHQDNCRWWRHGDLCDCGAATPPAGTKGGK